MNRRGKRYKFKQKKKWKGCSCFCVNLRMFCELSALLSLFLICKMRIKTVPRCSRK